MTANLDTNKYKRNIKEKNLEDGNGIGEKERLTNARTNTKQNFYECTICGNKGDVSKMSAGVWAISGHYSSTIEKPLHNDCPKGPKTWCSYQHKVLGTSVTSLIAPSL